MNVCMPCREAKELDFIRGIQLNGARAEVMELADMLG